MQASSPVHGRKLENFILPLLTGRQFHGRFTSTLGHRIYRLPINVPTVEALRNVRGRVRRLATGSLSVVYCVLNIECLPNSRISNNQYVNIQYSRGVYTSSPTCTLVAQVFKNTPLTSLKRGRSNGQNYPKSSNVKRRTSPQLAGARGVSAQ